MGSSAKDNRHNLMSLKVRDQSGDVCVCDTGRMRKDHELLQAEQVIRPTGLLDQEVEVRPVEGQIDDLIGSE